MDTGKPDFICLIQCFFSAGVENNSQNFAECEFLISFGCFSSVFGSIWQDVANPAESRQAFFSRLQIAELRWSLFTSRSLFGGNWTLLHHQAIYFVAVTWELYKFFFRMCTLTCLC
ncbi:hypothetical protein KC19_4G081800 [Ceratodon purpureus]|uniref:Uncharacterized protein n=1 Tax=Ceratodon purpureus TaxID=3225 RepID=A0A8T0I9Q5_CERPU|nr:hypothetical protein KC19_4G081800 [Ceratodon purpureus]